MPDESFQEAGMDYTDISAEHRVIGKLRVDGIHPLPGETPSVYVRLEYELRCMEADRPGTAPFRNYLLSNIYGEWRLAEHGNCIVRLHWGINHQEPQVYTHNTDGQIDMVGELMPNTLAVIERWRNGGPAKFWFRFWPSFIGTEWGVYKVVRTNPFEFEAKPNGWHELLDKCGYGRQELVEVPYSDLEGTDYKDALQYVARARKAFLEGRFEECGYNCREALNRVAQTVKADESVPNLPDGKRPHLDAFLKGVEESRARALREVFIQLNRIGDKATHSLHPMGWSEARFTFQTTVNLLALLGDLTRKRS